MLLKTYIWMIPCQLIQSCASNISKIHKISFAESSNHSDFKTLWSFAIRPVFPKLLLVNLQCSWISWSSNSKKQFLEHQFQMLIISNTGPIKNEFNVAELRKFRSSPHEITWFLFRARL